MVIDWGKILMDPIVQGAIITASGAIVIAVIGGFIKIICSAINEKKYFEFMKVKLGVGKTSSLEEQHDGIKEAIKENITGIRNTELLHISNKVDSIDKEIGINKERTASLNFVQANIRDNVNKLVNDWERVIAENKELKGRITELEKKNIELINIINKSKRRNKDIEI